MSDSNYGRQATHQGGPYGQYNPYAQQQNQQYGSAGGYGQQSGYGQQAGAYDSGYATQQERYSPGNRDNQAYEMNPMNGQTSERNDPNYILDECRDVGRGIQELERKVSQLRTLYRAATSIASAEEDRRHKAEIERVQNDAMSLQRNLARRVKSIQSKPESGNEHNKLQVGKIDSDLKKAMNDYREAGAEYRTILKEQARRQYLTIKPNATEAELTQVADDLSDQNLFSQALLDSDRRGQVQSARQAVGKRHDAIKKIEKDITEVAELFQELEASVIQQDAPVEDIKRTGEEVVDSVTKANVELDGAIVNKRKARRRKCWFFGLLLLIIIIIVVVVVVVVLVLRSRNNSSSPAPAPAPTTSGVRRIRAVRDWDMDHA